MSNELLSLSNGVMASSLICNNLETAKDNGEKAYLVFYNERLLEKTVQFSDRLKKLNLQTFSNVNKK